MPVARLRPSNVIENTTDEDLCCHKTTDVYGNQHPDHQKDRLNACDVYLRLTPNR